MEQIDTLSSDRSGVHGADDKITEWKPVGGLEQRLILHTVATVSSLSGDIHRWRLQLERT